jgi:hypothetical protein
MIDKRKKARIHGAAAVVVTLLAANAQAATLANIEGAVFVDHGDGFRPVVAGSELAPGDRVWADAGSANIVYNNGCSSRVGSNQTVAVLASAPACDGGSLKNASDMAPIDVDPVLVGGAAAAGAVGLAVALSTGGSPHSP